MNWRFFLFFVMAAEWLCDLPARMPLNRENYLFTHLTSENLQCRYVHSKTDYMQFPDTHTSQYSYMEVITYCELKTRSLLVLDWKLFSGGKITYYYTQNTHIHKQSSVYTSVKFQIRVFSNRISNLWNPKIMANKSKINKNQPSLSEP